MIKVRIGTRGSALALRQTNMVAEILKEQHPGIDVEIFAIRTKGDEVLDKPLAKIGDKGLFVKELEVALLRKEVDLAVHSMKDLPSDMPEGLCLAAVPERVDPSDVLITNGTRLEDLPDAARIGSSSLRRRAQLMNFRKDFHISDVRGNLDTRLRKLDEGEFDAIILAYAGLHRMGWTERITQKIPVDICVPAVGQGALALQARDSDEDIRSVVSTMDHPESRAAITAERSLMRVLEGGCQVPIGALARNTSGKLVLKAIVASIDGQCLVRGELTGDPDSPEALGEDLAQILLARGADRILAELR